MKNSKFWCNSEDFKFNTIKDYQIFDKETYEREINQNIEYDYITSNVITNNFSKTRLET